MSIFITFIDDYSRYRYVYLMRHKFEAFEKFREYKAEVEKNWASISSSFSMTGVVNTYLECSSLTWLKKG